MRARRPSNSTSAASPCARGRGRVSSENIAKTAARTAGRNAARYRRGSIKARRRGRGNLHSVSYASGKHKTSARMPTPPRILLVDDEQSVQTLLAYPLRKEGYEVVPALDGLEALNRASNQTFDLIVLDVMLPKVDGFEVCRQLRARSSVPII